MLPAGVANNHAFNTAAFTSLNEAKAARVFFLTVADTKPRLWLTAGERGGAWRSPFSAPYGGWMGAPDVSQRVMDEGAEALAAWARSQGAPLTVGLPPLVYDETFLAKSLYALSRAGRIELAQPDYYFRVADFADYGARLSRAARKNLNHAVRAGFGFEAFTDADSGQIARAYEVIRRNRAERGYPLAMSLDQVLATRALIAMDAFILSLAGRDSAAALVFRPLPDVALVVYWGNIAEASPVRPMNMLAYKVFEHYYTRGGMRLVDIGPSDVGGVPNHGLMEFKEGVGCRVSPRFTVTLGV